jgi:hypothetical protein
MSDELEMFRRLGPSSNFKFPPEIYLERLNQTTKDVSWYSGRGPNPVERNIPYRLGMAKWKEREENGHDILESTFNEYVTDVY